jgi:HK97 gp10 family phage protein
VSRDLQMKGMKELAAYLDALPANMKRNAISQGLRAMARPIVAEARLRAPKGSGQLAESIKAGDPHDNRDGTFSIRVRTDPKGNKHAFLGLFFEYGVRDHYITVPGAAIEAVNASLKPLKSGRRRGRQTLMKHLNRKVRDGSLVIGGNFVGPIVHHPGFRARPFLVPALDIRAEEAIAAFGGKVREYLEKLKAKTGYDVVGALDEAA